MRRFQTVLNYCIVTTGLLAAVSLLLGVAYAEIVPRREGAMSYVDTWQIMHVIAGTLVIVATACMAGLIIAEKPSQRFFRSCAMPICGLGGIVALEFATRLTPTSSVGASALDWLVVALFYVLAAAACMSFLVSLYLTSTTNDYRGAKSTHSPLEVR